ncbi:MAG TPA: putative quinol monooxygenase [Microbacteriaceae bacterium]
MNAPAPVPHSGPERILYAEFTALPGREPRVAELITQLGTRVRAEPGNIVFAVHRKTARPAEFFVYEEYEDEAAFQAHITADYGARFNAELCPLVAGGGSLVTWLDRL